MKGMLTVECSVIFTIPFDEKGKERMLFDGKEQTEMELEAGVTELFANDGVAAVSVICDIVSPEDLFEDEE